MERPLYAPVRRPAYRQRRNPVRDDEAEETDPAALFEQVYVDPGPLRGGVRQAPARRPQVGARRTDRATAARAGPSRARDLPVADDETFAVVFDERYREQVSWREPDGRGPGRPRCRRVTFARTGGAR